MAPYIYTERNGIYIIDLQKTVKKLEEAYNFVRDITADGGSILLSEPRSRPRTRSAKRPSALACSLSIPVGSAVC